MSRYPPFGETSSYPYDRTLLAGAPSITRADRQAGYNIDILERGVVPSAAPPNQTQGPNPFTDTPTDLLNKELYSHPAATDTTSVISPYRWYRTKRGIAIIVLTFLVVLSVIIGVAVGVTQEKQRQATTAAVQTPDVRSDSGLSSIITSTSRRRHTSTDTPFLTSDPIGPAPTGPLIAPSTGVPRPTRSLTTAPSRPTPVTPGSTVGPNQGGNQGNTGGGQRPDQSSFCKLLPSFC